MAGVSDCWKEFNKPEQLDEATGLISTGRYYPCDICSKITNNVLPRQECPELHVCSIECKNAVLARDTSMSS